MGVFISYARLDADWVDRFEADLRVAGVDVWIDRRRLPIALPWLREVRDSIEVASLAVACRSPAFGESTNCAAELTTAAQLGVPIIDVDVEGSVERAAERVIEAVHFQSEHVERSRTLLSRARIWERRDRSNRALLSSRDLRHLGKAPRPDDGRAALVDSFVAASRRRRRVRISVGAAAALLVRLAIELPSGVDEFSDEARADTEQIVLRMGGLSELRVVIDDDIYAGLSRVAELGETEAALDATVVSLALAQRTPNDGFILPTGSFTKFASSPIVDTVLLTDGDAVAGRLLASDGRTAGPIDMAVPDVPAADGVQIIDGVLRLSTGSELNSIITLERPSDTALRSPDGRMVAAAHGEGVDIYDIESGSHVLRLGGAGGDVVDLAWASDSSALWATTDRDAVGWAVRTGRALINDPDLLLRALMPASDDGAVWVLEEAGTLRLLNAAGEESRRIEIGRVSYSAQVSPDRRHIAVTGPEQLTLVEVETGEVSGMDAECEVSRPVFASADVVAIPCGAALIIVDVESWSITSSIELNTDLADQPIAVDQSGTIVMMGADGQLHELDGDRFGPAQTDRPLRCAAYFNDLDVSGAGLLLATGNRLGRIGCTTLAVPSDDLYRLRNGSFESVGSYRSRASAFAPTDDYALSGFADGTIVVWPVEKLTPQRLLVEASGDVFDVAIVGDEVYALTRTGMLVAFPLPELPSNANLAAEAGERLAIASALGLID